MNLTPEDIEQIRDRLQVLSPAAIYLFGSAAAGRVRPDSDFDIAVLPGARAGLLAPGDRYELQNELAEALGRDVDLVDLARASTVLRKEVVAGGRVIAEADPGRRAEFEMYVLSDYARLNEERAPVLAACGQSLPAHA